MIIPIEVKIHIVNSKWEVKTFIFPGKDIQELIKEKKGGDDIDGGADDEVQKIKGTIYNIDKITDLREKIHMYLSIAPERQHLRGLNVPFAEWYKLNKNRKVEVAKILTSKALTSKVIRLDTSAATYDNTFPRLLYKEKRVIIDNILYEENRAKVYSVPIDKKYEIYKEMEVDNTDMFITTFAPHGDIVLVDLNDYIPYNIPTKNISTDTYSFEIIYYGFIKKYYPHLKEEDFYTYLKGKDRNRELNEISDIKSKILRESSLLAPAKKKKMQIRASVVHAVLEIAAPIGPEINLRNLFDKFHLTGHAEDLGVQMLHIILKSGFNKMQVIKQKINSPKYKIPYDLRDGLTMVFSSRQYINIREDGSWIIRNYWREEEEMDLDKIYKYNKKVTDKLIDYINSNIVFFGKEPLQKIAADNSKFVRLSKYIFWDKVVSAAAFRELRQQFNEFTLAGFSESKQTPLLEVYWLKGALHKCTVRIQHRITDIKIEIMETNDSDLENIEDILVNYIQKLELPEEIERDEGQKLVKKLREQDPRLYDGLKDDLVYSKQCQGVRQPIVLTDKEYKEIKASEKSLLRGKTAAIHQYWNFTKNAPAYYQCQRDPKTRQELHFGYLTGIHKSNWCVPCCKLKAMNEDSKNYDRHQTCNSKHEYIEEAEAQISRYILIPYKPLDIGRLGYVPDFVKDILGRGYYVYGVPQTIPAVPEVGGLPYAIAAALNITIEEFIKQGTKILTNPNLAAAMVEIFSRKVDFYDWSDDWVKIFIDMTLEAFDRNVIIFTRDNLRARLNSSPKILIMEFDNYYYPIFKIDPMRYYYEREITERVFTQIPNIDNVIPDEPGFTLNKVIAQIRDSYDIQKLFVNLSNRCYGILVGNKDRAAYIPVIESPIISKIELEYSPLEHSKYNLDIGLAVDICKKTKSVFNATLWLVDQSHSSGSSSSDSSSKSTPEFIGFIANDLYYYTNRLTDADKLPAELAKLPRVETNIDYEKINKAIAQHQGLSERIKNLYSEGYYNHMIYKLIKIEILNLIQKGELSIDEVKKFTPLQLAAKIPHVISDRANTTENILVPCDTFYNIKGDKNGIAHCDGKKLIVPSTFMEFLEIMLHEINDPIIDFVESNLINVVIDDLLFEEVKGEKVEKALLR